MINVIENIGKFGAKAECSQCGCHYEVKCKYSAANSLVGDLCKPCKTVISGMKALSQSELKKAFIYYPKTGALCFRHTSLSGTQGDVATYAHSAGYLSVCIGGKQYLAHRVIYMYMTGNWPKHVDHINHEKTDNRWDNLRSVEQIDNNRNMPLQANTTTGITGVSIHKPTGKYRAYITVAGKAKHLGLFDNLAEAQSARADAETRYGYHANHGK